MAPQRKPWQYKVVPDMSVIRKRQLEGLLHQRKTVVVPEEELWGC